MIQMERIIKYWQEKSNLKAVQLLLMKPTGTGVLVNERPIKIVSVLYMYLHVDSIGPPTLYRVS